MSFLRFKSAGKTSHSIPCFSIFEASNIEKQGIECDVLPADLNLKNDIQNIQSIVEDKYGRLDMLIHAACQIHDDLVLPKPFWEKSTDLWSVIEVGLKSNYFLSHARMTKKIV